jgi:hypothetical protein
MPPILSRLIALLLVHPVCIQALAIYLRITVTTSLATFAAASRAVTVMTFDPFCSVIPDTDQLAVPAAVPLPPRLLVQVTCVTPTLSEAIPPKLIELELVL